MTLKAYIAGPMRGIDCFNFPAFFECEEYLVRLGCDVRNPARHDREAGFDETKNSLEGFDMNAAMLWDLEQIAEVDTIVLLPGWSKSAGVALERHMARFLDKKIAYYHPGSFGHRLSGAPLPGDRDGNLPTEPAKPASGEVRVTNPTTGGQKGTKPARFDLIPAFPLWALAEVYGKGAVKYTHYGECTCSALKMVATETPGAADSAGATTRRACDSATPSMPSVSERTPAPGTQPTRSESENIGSDMEGAQVGRRTPGDTDSLLTSTRSSSLGRADSAARSTRSATLTTITTPVASGARSVTGAISPSGLSSAGGMTGSAEHKPGCGALTIAQKGDRNWERGYDWSLSFASLQRHAWLFWMGQDCDEETGLPHMAHAAWHCFTILQFMADHPGLDDRPGRLLAEGRA